MTVYAYQRLSAFERSEEGLVDAADENAQTDRYCADNKWPGVEWHIEHTENWRLGFCVRLSAPAKSADSWLPSSGDVLVVYGLQRIFNSAQDAVRSIRWLRSMGVPLHVVSLKTDVCDPMAASHVDDMLDAFRVIETRRGAERMRAVKQGQRHKGRFLGGSKPFGYMVHANGKLIENPMEQRVLKQIKQLRERGWSLRAIADKVSTPVAPISFKTVQRVLQRGD